MWVEAHRALHQALPAQHLVDTRNATSEPIGRVEDRRVAIGNLHGQREQVSRNVLLIPHPLACHQKLDGLFGPASPVTEKTADDVQTLLAGSHRNAKGG